MPEISRFDGIVITMYFNDHNSPHFHVEYNGMEAIYDMNESAFIKGAIPSKQARLVLAWAEIHKNEFIDIDPDTIYEESVKCKDILSA